MKKTKYYAVKKGNETGIFESWDECQKSIKGFPGAEYKSFSSYDEAEAYIEGVDLNTDLIKKNQSEGFCTIFCDGSYKKDDTSEYYSGAFLLITSDDKESCHNFRGNNKNFLEHTNVTGELLAALNAIENAISFEQDKIRLYYDFEGIEKWATGEWKAKTDLSKFYASKMKELMELVDIQFVKVKGHTNNSLNEQVDQMAKDALNGTKIHKKMGLNFIHISNITSEKYEELLNLIKCVDTIKVFRKNNNSSKILDEIKDSNGSKVTMTYFVTKRAMLIQGDSKKFAFQLSLTLVNEMFEDVKIEKILNQSYQQKIDLSCVEPLEEVLPNLPKDYPNGIIKLLKQALINLKYHFDAEDYSMYAFPALRALEGHIKFLLLKNGYELTTPNLICFEKEGMHYRFNDKSNPLYQENVKWNKIEKCYDIFAYKRHSYFHYGSLIGISDDTSIMESFDECEEMIQKVFAIIQESL